MSAPRRLLVVGAGGRTGRLLAALATAEGHPVTALARTPESVAGIAGLSRVVAGDATDRAAVDDAVAGSDAVVTAIAAAGRGPGTEVSAATRCVVAAMQAAGVRRLAITSSRNLTATRPRVPVTLTRRVFRHVYADLARAEEVVRGSDLDWTIIRATMLADAPSRGGVHIDRERDPTGGDWRLPRADFARALLDTVLDPDAIGAEIGVNGLR